MRLRTSLPKQASIACDGRRHAGDLDVVARAFFRDESQKVDGLRRIELFDMVQPARQQDLLDQRVQFGKVADDLLLAVVVRRLLVEVDRHAQARKRRAQFVAGIGEQEPGAT